MRIPQKVSRAARATVLGVLVLFVAVGPSRAQTSPPDAGDGAIGAELDELLRLARQFNPELAAMALEREAALARALAADSLPDPMFRASFEDINRRRGSLAPQGNVGAIFYSVSQEFPLWGKRDLRRNIALADAEGAHRRHLAMDLELAARVTAAFAQYYQAVQSTRVTEEVHNLLRAIASIAQARVAQGISGAQEVLRVETEKIAVTTSLAGFDRDRRAAQAKLNALLDRPAGAPLAEPSGLRRLPPREAVQLDALIETALAASPLIAAGKAEIAAAGGARTLAQKSWYPDVTLGLSAVDRERQFTAYEAMIEFKIPLRWGLRDAEIREASLKLGASGARLEATKAKLRNDIEDAYWGLETTRRVETMLRDSLLPQAQAAYRAALAAYQQGRADLSSVLETDRRLREARLDLLKVQTEQQLMLADLERLIGGSL